MDPRLLTESGLKAILSKHKIKDNGLQKALAAYEKLGDDAHDERHEQIARVGTLAAALKKVKEVAANKVAAEYLENLLDAADNEEKAVSKDKQAAQETEAANRKKAQQGQREQDDEEDEEDEEDEDEGGEEEQGDYGERLLNAFRKLRSMNGRAMRFLVCEARPFCGLMIAKRIGGRQKKELTELTGGSKKFLKIGTCFFSGGKYRFELERTVPGLARKLRLSVRNFTGKKFPMIVGGEAAEEDEGEEGEEQGTEEAETPETASQADTETSTPPSGRETGAAGSDATAEEEEDISEPAKSAEPDGRAATRSAGGRPPEAGGTPPLPRAGQRQTSAPPPGAGSSTAADAESSDAANPGTTEESAGADRVARVPGTIPPPRRGRGVLAEAPEVWHETRQILETNLNELREAVSQHYSATRPDKLDKITRGMTRLDGVLDKLDHRLTDSLTRARSARDEAARTAELRNAKAILIEYIKYVKTEPLIALVDRNPFGIATNIKRVLIDSLTHMAEAIS